MIVKKSMLVRKSADMMPPAESFGVNAPVEDDVAATRALEGVRISFRMPAELHRRLKLDAYRRGRTVKGTIEGWVREMTPAA